MANAKYIHSKIIATDILGAKYTEAKEIPPIQQRMPVNIYIKKKKNKFD